MTTYDFESSDEGFTLVGQQSLEYTWDDMETPDTGQSDSYFFEFNNPHEYDVVQSINSYSVGSFAEVYNTKVLHKHGMVERRTLQYVELQDIYENIVFRGEMK